MGEAKKASEEEGTRLMEKASQEQTQQQKHQLKCPRCESTNTKFCYYNNYSLSQPRHFCKGCKRYWTRGGTLRSVPVGGGCRKNKRIRRINSNHLSYNSSSSVTTVSPSEGAHMISTSPLLYGLPLHEGFQFSSCYENLGGNGVSGLGFGGVSGLGFGSSGVEQHQNRFNFETLLPYELDLEIKGVGSHASGKLNGDNHGQGHGQGQIQNGYENHIHDHEEPAMEGSDPSTSMLWNNNSTSNETSIGFNWLDPNYSTLGSSSVPPLI